MAVEKEVKRKVQWQKNISRNHPNTGLEQVGFTTSVLWAFSCELERIRNFVDCQSVNQKKIELLFDLI